MLGIEAFATSDENVSVDVTAFDFFNGFELGLAIGAICTAIFFY